MQNDSEADRIEAFKQRTIAKLRGLRCPHHGQTPRLRFHGASLRDTTISLSACCDPLIQLANKAIAIR